MTERVLISVAIRVSVNQGYETRLKHFEIDWEEVRLIGKNHEGKVAFHDTKEGQNKCQNIT